MLVTFTTDDSVSDFRGFSAAYSNGGIAIKIAILPHDKSFYANSYILHIVCGATYSEKTGNITSTNYYPRHYFNKLDCEYIIDLRSSGASSVTLLTFIDFQTEAGYDNVYVYLVEYL